MISKELLDILVCPENHMPLALADEQLIERLNRAIRSGALKKLSGEKVSEEFEGGLVREDRKVLYPIIDGIPVLLVEEAIAVDETT